MFKALTLLPSALIFAFLAQQPPADKAIPADAATRTNPVTATPESQAHAKMIYGIDCAMCHGANGNGKGDLVADMNLTMKDLGDPATLKGMSDGEIFYVIKNGKGKMPGEGDRAKDDDVWNLVILVRSFAKK
jgi:mono/diheme cytochrome c family protein